MTSLRNLARHLLESFSSKNCIRRGEISCSPHALLDKTKDSAMESEREEFVMGPAPPLVHSAHTAAGNAYRAPPQAAVYTAFVSWCVENRDKNS